MMELRKVLLCLAAPMAACGGMEMGDDGQGVAEALKTPVPALKPGTYTPPRNRHIRVDERDQTPPIVYASVAQGERRLGLRTGPEPTGPNIPQQRATFAVDLGSQEAITASFVAVDEESGISRAVGNIVFDVTCIDGFSFQDRIHIGKRYFDTEAFLDGYPNGIDTVDSRSVRFWASDIQRIVVPCRSHPLVVRDPREIDWNPRHNVRSVSAAVNVDAENGLYDGRWRDREFIGEIRWGFDATRNVRIALDPNGPLIRPM